jgi:hypothetical protein
MLYGKYVWITMLAGVGTINLESIVTSLIVVVDRPGASKVVKPFPKHIQIFETCSDLSILLKRTYIVFTHRFPESVSPFIISRQEISHITRALQNQNTAS